MNTDETDKTDIRCNHKNQSEHHHLCSTISTYCKAKFIGTV